MAKYQVNLGITANTQQAQQSIQALQKNLNDIANTKITVSGGSIDNAAKSARMLNEYLTKATNATTGKIDFTALSHSLKSANTDLATLSNNLLAMGPKGQQAFSQVANAVAHAELSTRKANSALQNFGVTLMNTIKWQAASSMIHEVMGAFNSAVSHIEKLDKSLNSIQIVTGKTSAEMASFAKQAQDLSKALSSTTTEYADAALIYFQQGLGEQAIAERTEATLKMAKVTGDSVQTVSDQLTAIWNNFDDGTQSLESYVDIITALGAATASSTDEISDGLQKFAAIAETVGLSYEYAATALATVTSETRQSADVVGTAFKTLFARIQGLNLGETLDDGTTLNKYSQALAKVGIDIKNANGSLKDMDDILDEMGEKWKHLNEDQRVALAQTVGGARQYNQLMSLMDNWDTFEINLEIAENAEGELDKQFQIYQSSIEASSAELKNATQTLYESLLNPEVISTFNEGLAETIGLVNTLIEDAGGVGKLFEFGGLLLLQMILPKLQEFIMTAGTKIKDFIGYTKAAKMDELNKISATSHNVAETDQITNNNKQPGFMPNTQGITTVDVNASGSKLRNQMVKEEAGYTASIVDTKKQILALENGLTAKQQEHYKNYQNQIEQQQEILRIAREKQALAKDNLDNTKRQTSLRVGASEEGRSQREIYGIQDNDKIDFAGQETRDTVAGIQDSGISDSGQMMTAQIMQNLTKSQDLSGPAASIENLEKLGQLQAQYNADAEKANGIYTEITKNIGNAGKRTQEQEKALKKTSQAMKTLGDDAKNGLVANLEKSVSSLKNAGKNVEGLQKVISSLGKEGEDIDLGSLNEDELKAVQSSVGNLSKGLTEASDSAQVLSEAMSDDMANATGQDAAMFTGVAKNAHDAKQGALEADAAAKQLQETLNTQPPIMPDVFGTIIQGAQQAVTSFTSFAMGARMLSTGITAAFDENSTAVEKLVGTMMILQGVMSTVKAIQQAANVVDTIAVAIKAAKAAATTKEAAAESKSIASIVANTIATAANAVAKLFAAEASKGLAGIIAGVLGAALIASTIAIVANTVATKQEAEEKEKAAKAAEEEAAGHRDNAEALRQETEELNKNADSYRELYKIYLETHEIKSELAESAYELASSLDVEGASLLILTGNYEKLNEEIEKYLNLKNQEAMKKASEAVDAAGRAFAQKAGEGDGFWADDGNNDNQYTTGLWAGTKNTDWISQFLASEAGKKYADAGINFIDGKLIANYDKSDPSQLAYLWNLIDELMNSQDFWSAAPDSFDVTTNTLITSFQNMKEELGTTYDDLLSSTSLELDQALISGITESGIHKATDFTSFSEAYENYISYITEKAGPYADATKIIADAEEYLRGHSQYGDLFQKFDAFRDLPANVKDYIQKNNLLNNSEAMDLLFSVHFNDSMTEDEITKTIGIAQKIADNEKILMQAEIIPQLSSSLKDDMTYDEWQTWFEGYEKQFGDFKENTGMSKEAFMSMGAEAATDFLNSLTPSQEQQESALQSNINQWTEARDILQNQERRTTRLTGVELAIAEMYHNYEQENVAAGLDAALSGEQLQNIVNMATQNGYEISDAGDLINRVFPDLQKKSVNPFTGETQNLSDFFASEVDRMEDDLIANTERLSQIDSYNTQIQQAQSEIDYLNATSWKSEATAAGLDIKEVDDYAQALLELNPALENNLELARQIAIAEKKQAKGVEDLTDNYDDYVSVLKKAKLDPIIKGTEQYTKTITALRKDLSLLTGVSEDVFTEDFINSDEIQQALTDVANGVDGAIERLKALSVMEQIEVEGKVKMDEEGWNDLKAAILDANSQKIEIGAYLQDDSALDSLYNILAEAGYTANQIQDFFNDIGWEPELDYVEMPLHQATSDSSYANKMVWVPVDGGLDWQQVSLTDAGSMGLDTDTIIRVPRIGNKMGGGSSSFKKTDPAGSGSKNNNNKGGGGGSKAPEKKSSSDKTRYHTIQNQLEDLKSEYEEISEAADRAFGKDKLEHIDDQIAKTEELIAAQEELLGTYGDWDMSGYDPDNFGGFETLRQNLQFDKEVMEAYFSDLFKDGMKIEYDEKGNISNYRQLEDYMQSVYNKNTTKLKGEKWEAFEKQYEKMQEYIEQYEETYDELRDAEKEYQDLINRRMDLELTKIQYAAELNLTISDESLDYIEYQLDLIGDDVTKSTESIALNAKKAEAIYDKINTTQNAMNDILDQVLDSDELDAFYANGYVDWDNLTGENGMEINFTADQIDALKEYRDNLLDMNSELAGLRETVEEQLLEVFDHWNEKIQDGISAIDDYNGMLDTYRNIIDVVGKDTLGIDDSFIGGLANKQIQGAINSLEATKDAYDSIVATQTKAQEELEKARAREDEESVKYWEETLETLNENAREAQSELLSSWENALSTIADQFEATVERLVTSFSNSIYSLGGLEGLSEDFSRTQENRDMMLDDYQKIYELSKLTRDINGKLDDTKIIAGKQKLRDLIKEINEYQEEGVKMSQYDLEYLQAEYELRLAEIELEEAQRAKNTVRMSRDNEGNWSYIYTQNTDAVDAAQQKYEDALYAMQDLSSNYIDEMSEQLISTSQEMQEALVAIRIQDYANINDYYAEVERVQKQYQDELAMQEAELNKAIDNNKELYDTDWTNYHNATGYKISDTKDFATAFRDTLLGTLMDSESDTSNFSTIIGTSVDTLVQGLRNSADQYFQNIAAAMEAAGTATDAFSKDAQEDIDDIIAKSDEGATAVEDMSERMQTAFDTAADNLVLWQETYGTVISAMIEQNEALVESFNKMFEALSATGEDFNIATNIEFKKISSEEPDTGFDTGGYTGEWGKSGKLAILHEKELVLNASDTENLFKTLLLSSQILETIDLNARQASLGMGAMTAAAIKDDSTQTLEQMVHITAEFPGVSDRNELEEAFDNLINRAAQYAYRTL